MFKNILVFKLSCIGNKERDFVFEPKYRAAAILIYHYRSKKNIYSYVARNILKFIDLQYARIFVILCSHIMLLPAHIENLNSAITVMHFGKVFY